MSATQTVEQNRFLDSMYLVSHSAKTIQTYKTALNHFRAFTISEYNCTELELVEQIKSDKLDVY